MTQALEAMGRHWRIAYVSASLASLCAAVEDGLGITLLPRRLAGAGHRVLGPEQGFAPVPDLELTLHAQSELPAPTRDLAAQLIAVCERAMRA